MVSTIVTNIKLMLEAMIQGLMEIKMKKTIFFGIGLLLVLGIASLIGVLAYKGNPDVKGPNYDPDVHQQLEAAIDAGDYDAWLQIRQENNLPMKGKIFRVINADNFPKFAELHNAMQDGDTAKADAIRAELGLGQGMMKRGCGAAGQGGGNCQKHSASQGVTCNGGCQKSVSNAGTHSCGMTQ